MWAFPVSVSRGWYREERGNGWGVFFRDISFTELVPLRSMDDASVFAKFGYGGADRCGAHATLCAQLLHGDGTIELGEGGANPSGWGVFRRRFCGADFDVPGIHQCEGEAGVLLEKFERDVVARWGGAVFGGEGQLFAAAAHVEVGVAPAMEFAGAAQGLAGTR